MFYKVVLDDPMQTCVMQLSMKFRLWFVTVMSSRPDPHDDVDDVTSLSALDIVVTVTPTVITLRESQRPGQKTGS